MKGLFDWPLVSNYHSFISTFLEAGCLELSEMVTNPELEVKTEQTASKVLHIRSLPLHRFKKPGSKNFQNIFSPIRTLHLSNIPESTTEDDLRDLFLEYGSINNFRFFPKDRRMALMQLSSTEEAILCLIKLHNYKLNESSHLRVSFAKNEMWGAWERKVTSLARSTHASTLSSW